MKVLMVSRLFPKDHPKFGQQTWFVERIMACLADKVPGWQMKDDFVLYDWYAYYNCTMPKSHTIRAGSRFKPGDMASLRVWTGLPYRSKQIEFAQVEVKKTWEIIIHKIANTLVWNVEGVGSGNFDSLSPSIKIIAGNDGLEVQDFIEWFAIHPKKKDDGFRGQIICWSPNINY